MWAGGESWSCCLLWDESRLQAVESCSVLVLVGAARFERRRRGKFAPPRTGGGVAIVVLQRRHVAATSVAHVGTARMEAAARWRGQGARDVAFQERALAHQRGIGQRHRRQERAGVGM